MLMFQDKKFQRVDSTNAKRWTLDIMYFFLCGLVPICKQKQLAHGLTPSYLHLGFLQVLRFPKTNMCGEIKI